MSIWNLNDRLQNGNVVYDYYSNEADRVMKKDHTLSASGPDRVFNTDDDIELSPLN